MPNKEISRVVPLMVLGNLAALIYVFQVAHGLTPHEYALFASISFAINVVALATGALQNITAYDMAHQLNGDKSGTLLGDFRIRRVMQISVALSLTLILILAFIQGFTSESFQRYSTVAAYIPAATLMSLGLGRLQGAGQMVYMTWLVTLGVVLKPITFLLVQTLGATALSASWALALSGYVVAVFSLFAIRKFGAVRPRIDAGHTVYLVVTGIIFWAATGLDVLLLSLVLTSEDAGPYALVATLARVGLTPAIYFSQKYFPIMIKRHEENQSSSRLLQQISIKGLIFLFAVAVGALTFGDWTIGIIVPYDPAGLGKYVGIYCVTLIPLTVAVPLLQMELIKVNRGLLLRLLTLIVAGVLVIGELSSNFTELLLFSGVMNLAISSTLVFSRYSLGNFLSLVRTK